MDNTLKSLTHDFFAALDRKDFDHLVAISADDVQVVDEISGGWLRGRQDIEAYLHQLGEEVSNIASSPRDVHTAEIDSVGIVTLVLDSTLRLRGQPVEITAPTTLVARRVSDGWRWVVYPLECRYQPRQGGRAPPRAGTQLVQLGSRCPPDGHC